MKKGITLLVIILFFLILEVTLLDYVKVLGVKPDLLVILTIFFTLYLKSSLAITLAIILGLLKDSLSIDPFGINTIFFSLFSYSLVRMSKNLYRDDRVTQIILVSTILVVTVLAKIFLFSFLKKEIFINTPVAGISFIEVLYTGALSPLLFLLLRKLL